MSLIVPSICRQAQILERKRQKKLRQKEQKARERLENDAEINGNISSTGDDVSPGEASLTTCDFEAHSAGVFADHDSSPLVTYHCPDTNVGVDNDTDQNVERRTSQGGTRSGYDCDSDQNVERQSSPGHHHRRTMAARRQGLPKSQRTIATGLYASQNSQMSKFGVIQKYRNNRDQRAAPVVNSCKVWSRKPKAETDAVVIKAGLPKELGNSKNHEVLIGSVSVKLGNCSQSQGDLVTSQADSLVENLTEQITTQEKPIKPDSFQGGNSRLRVKLWRPVSQHGAKDPSPLQSGGTEAVAVYGKDYQNLSAQSRLRLCNVDGGNIGSGKNNSHIGDKVDSESFRLSSHDAKAFLARSKLFTKLYILVFFLLCSIDSNYAWFGL